MGQRPNIRDAAREMCAVSRVRVMSIKTNPLKAAHGGGASIAALPVQKATRRFKGRISERRRDETQRLRKLTDPPPCVCCGAYSTKVTRAHALSELTEPDACGRARAGE